MTKVPGQLPHLTTALYSDKNIDYARRLTTTAVIPLTFVPRNPMDVPPHGVD